MNIYPWAFEVGDVVITHKGETRLIKQVSDDLWRVHYLDTDDEGKMFFSDQTRYRVVEVKG